MVFQNRPFASWQYHCLFCFCCDSSNFTCIAIKKTELHRITFCLVITQTCGYRNTELTVVCQTVTGCDRNSILTSVDMLPITAKCT